MEPRQRTSIEQFSALLDFMERNGDLSARLNTPANTSQNTVSAQSALSVSLPPSPQPSTAQPAPAQQPAQAAAAQPTATAQPTAVAQDTPQPVAAQPVAAQATPQPAATQAAPIPAATPQYVQNNNQQPSRVYRRRRRRSSASSATNTTSRRRELLTARRNSGQTPFERAANHFTDIELRRLEFEEQRDKRNHELEVERIRIEAQRVDVSRQQTVLLRQLYQLGQQIMVVLSNNTVADQNEQLQ